MIRPPPGSTLTDTLFPCTTLCRAMHHGQGMVGDDDIGLRRRARRSFDEAFAEMRTAGIDAYAAPVGQRGGAVAAKQGGEPAGQVAADHVAVASIGDRKSGV